MKDVLEAATIRMDRATARQAFLDYRHAVRERHQQEDAQIMRGYQALSQGKQLVNLREVIGAGGVFNSGLPRLAVAQADHEWVWCVRLADGRVDFLPGDRWSISSRRVKGITRFPSETLPSCRGLGHDVTKAVYGNHGHGSHEGWGGDMRAMVPIVPPALRPVHALSNYLTLFEVANWAKAPRPPGDPALLKHIGGEIYAVLAVWDLTPLEQAVLSSRNLRGD